MSKSAEGINFSVSNMSSAGRRQSRLNTITLEKVLAWIDGKNLQEPILVKELKKMAAVYPEKALENWMKNFQIHLTRARKNIKSKEKIEIIELGEEPIAKETVEYPAPPEKAPSFDEF